MWTCIGLGQPPALRTPAYRIGQGLQVCLRHTCRLKRAAGCDHDGAGSRLTEGIGHFLTHLLGRAGHQRGWTVHTTPQSGFSPGGYVADGRTGGPVGPVQDGYWVFRESPEVAGLATSSQ
jgi:hypothetical protein